MKGRRPCLDRAATQERNLIDRIDRRRHVREPSVRMTIEVLGQREYSGIVPVQPLGLSKRK